MKGDRGKVEEVELPKKNLIKNHSLSGSVSRFWLYLYLRVLSSPWCVVAIVNRDPDSAKNSRSDIPNAAPSTGFVPAPT